MKKDDIVFEPITEKQRNYLLALSMGVTRKKFEYMVKEVAGLPDMDFLSKSEASYLIEKLKINDRRPDCNVINFRKPYIGRRRASKFEGAAENMPSAKLIYSIRQSFKNLGWGLARVHEYLKKNGVNSFDEMTRDKALDLNRKLYGIMGGKDILSAGRRHIRSILKEAF